MAEELLDLGDVTLCLESFGDEADPTLLLMSGACESMDGWEPDWCRELAAGGRRVVRYDHRDTGRSTTSPPGRPAYTTEAIAGDPLRILDALGVERAHLVGLSMGAGIAQELAARHGERVATVTLIATSPAGERVDRSPLPGPEARVARTFGEPAPEPDWTDRRAVADYLVEAYRPYAGSLGFDEASTRRLVEVVIDRTTDIEAATKNHWLLDGGPTEFAMSDISAPALVLHGTTDPMFPFPHGEALAREIPDATLVPMPGMGHERPPGPLRAAATELILRHTALTRRPAGPPGRG
jgi:pimeloyl-ACP methyl ester carboxylesterase